MYAKDGDCCTKYIFHLKFAEFDEIMHSDPESLKNIISKVLTWLIRTRWRRAIWGTLSVIKCKCGRSVQPIFYTWLDFFSAYLFIFFHFFLFPFFYFLSKLLFIHTCLQCTFITCLIFLSSSLFKHVQLSHLIF